ncbi:MAG: hypothetical protein B6U89_03090 [Desulfurococcales archaeon ex4484_58]|nr:MAG: hypothetical protein B6U89_03090 [Desulfurococcales archaeon ex4484_58]
MRIIPIEHALNDLLREYGITIDDLLIAMRYEDLDVYDELVKRIDNPTKELLAELASLSWRTLALTLFVLQAFYIINPSGLYKGCIIDPPREVVMRGFKASCSGLKILINRLKNLG